MSTIYPLDRLEAELHRGTVPDTTSLGGLDLPDAIEFSALRWSWWHDRHEDLLAERLPDLVESWPALRYLQTSSQQLELLSPFNTRRLGAHRRNGALGILELPIPGKEWGPGGEVLFFQDRFKSALIEAGMEAPFARALTAALKELASNAVEHAASPVAPLACYEISGQSWAIAVTDVGRGVLASLRENPLYESLVSHTKALELALSPGVSRFYNEAGHGNGFLRVFKALVDRRAALRFRSGGAAAHWEGVSPTNQEIVFKGRPLSRKGFHIRVAGPFPRKGS